MWNYYRDEVTDAADKIAGNLRFKNKNNKTTASKSFEYKTKMIWRTRANNKKLNTENVARLEYLSNFLRSLDLPLINFEIELDLTWSENCVIYLKYLKY